jgi:hypothetical protein
MVKPKKGKLYVILKLKPTVTATPPLFSHAKKAIKK